MGKSPEAEHLENVIRGIATMVWEWEDSNESDLAISIRILRFVVSNDAERPLAKGGDFEAQLMGLFPDIG